MRQLFLRGVSAMNMQALQLFRRNAATGSLRPPGGASLLNGSTATASAAAAADAGAGAVATGGGVSQGGLGRGAQSRTTDSSMLSLHVTGRPETQQQQAGYAAGASPSHLWITSHPCFAVLIHPI